MAHAMTLELGSEVWEITASWSLTNAHTNHLICEDLKVFAGLVDACSVVVHCWLV